MSGEWRESNDAHRESGRAHAVPLDPYPSPLVIGYGNPLRSDDGFGWKVAHELATRLPPGVATVLAVHQLTPELAESIAAASTVIFVDVDEGGQAGEMTHRTVAAAEGRPVAFSHETEPETLLALADWLYGRCPPAIIVSVGGADFGYGADLSPAVAAATPFALAQIAELLGVRLGASEQQGRSVTCTK